MMTDRLINKIATYQFSNEETQELMQYDPTLLEHALKLVDKIKPQRVFPYLLKICERQNTNPDRDLIRLRAAKMRSINQPQLNSFDHGQPHTRQYEPKQWNHKERLELRLRRLTYLLSVVAPDSHAEKILKEDYERIMDELNGERHESTTTNEGIVTRATIPTNQQTFN